MLRAICVASALVGCCVTDAIAQQDAERPAAEQVIAKIKAKYGKLRSYHFEHTLIAEVSSAGKAEAEKPMQIGKVSLISASERLANDGGTWDEMQSQGLVPFETRSRLEATGTWGTFVLTSDGTKHWSYNSASQEYIERDGRAALGPTAATMFASLHVAPLGKYADGRLKEPKLLKDEELQIGDVKKPCYVIAGHVQPENTLQGVTGVLFLMQIHAFVEKPDFFVPPAKDTQPKLQMWVDQKDFTVWQSRFTETVPKQGAAAEEKSESVELTVIDRYTVAKIDAELPVEFLRFTPPKGAKRVEKFGEMRPAPEK